MNTSNKTKIVKDFKEKSILVSREFIAPVDTIWNAFTSSKTLDKWWGPAPWRAETKTMNFSVGGSWLYAMVGPENQKHWGRMNYLAIDHFKRIEIEDAFCDDNGNLNRELPVSKGQIAFTKTGNSSRVDFKMIYPTVADLHKLIEMGFEEGITICLDQLEELIKK
jgi:uncharacterized protein YndB with AHSA1/START domain